MTRAVAVLALAASIFLAGGAASVGSVPHWKAWLCLPNHQNDWCDAAMPTAVVSATGAVKRVNVVAPTAPSVDCFYVYPTVSTEPRGNADLRTSPTRRPSTCSA